MTSKPEVICCDCSALKETHKMGLVHQHWRALPATELRRPQPGRALRRIQGNGDLNTLATNTGGHYLLLNYGDLNQGGRYSAPENGDLNTSAVINTGGRYLLLNYGDLNDGGRYTAPENGDLNTLIINKAAVQLSLWTLEPTVTRTPVSWAIVSSGKLLST
jgi:hypothetical protein